MKEYYSFAHTSIGFSHIASGKVCQDHSARRQDGAASVIVVSDGHGSSNFTRSDRGSGFACQVTLDAADAFLRDLKLEDLENEALRDGIVTQLCKYILLQWNNRVDEDVQKDPFTEEEVKAVSDKYRERYLRGEAAEHAYGCTLIAVILTPDFCLAIRNGDGQCVAVDGSGGFTTPVPWNDNCEFNVTTSLCDHEAIENFRYFYTTDLPAAVFINSDGVDDSYTSVEEVYTLYRTICLKALSEGCASADAYVETALPEITKRGSTDDVSIAGLMDPAALEGGKSAMEDALEQRQLQLAKERRELRKRVLIRDIKVAEKKRAKAIAQRQDVRKMLREVRIRQGSFLEQISIFKKKADVCEEGLTSLLRDESALTSQIDEADGTIAKLTSELFTLDEPPAAPAGDQSPPQAPPEEEAPREPEGTPDGEVPSPESPEEAADQPAEPVSRSAEDPPE